MYTIYEDYPDLIFEGLTYDLSNNSYEIVTEGLNFKEGFKKIWSKLGIIIKKFTEKVKSFGQKIKEFFIKLQNGMKTIIRKGLSKLIRIPFSSTLNFDAVLEYFEKAVPKALSAMPAIESYFDFFNRTCGKYAYNKDDKAEFPAVRLQMKQQEIVHSYFEHAQKLNKQIIIDEKKPMTLSYKEYVIFEKIIEIIVSNGFINKIKECEQRCFVFLKWIQQTDFKSVNALDAQAVISKQRDVASGFVTSYTIIFSNCNAFLRTSMSILKIFNACLIAIPGGVVGYAAARFKTSYKEKEEPKKKEENENTNDNSKQNNTNDNHQTEPEYERPKYAGLI